MNPEPVDLKWDLRFFSMAETVAEWSKDPTTKVGTVIVSPSRRQFSVGYNGFVSGAIDDYEGLGPHAKNELSVHAELNAILNARSSVEGWTMYTTKFPCQECAKAIIQAGVKAVVTGPLELNSKWYDSQKAAQNMFIRANVRFRLYT